MTIYLIRHASAGGRGHFGSDDLDRPLDAMGHDQSAQIVELLGTRGIQSVHSSRAIRCFDTVVPLAAHVGVEVIVEPSLVEGQSATMAIHLIRQLASTNTTAAMCSHGDIIPDAIQTLAREGMVIVGPRAWAKGSTWELRTRGGDITEAHFLGPY